jgi:DNA-binding CsgD family transcriptional regulator
MNRSVEQEVLDYGSLLKHLTNDQINVLKNAIVNLKTLGVSAYAERFIDLQGNSIKICNNYKWKELENDRNFFEDFSCYASLELSDNFKLKNKIITRSRDKLSHSFLQRLEQERLNSSVIVNEFYNKCIAISYFMVDPSVPQNRDLILNNLKIIELIRKEIQTILLHLFMSDKINQNKKVLLSKESIGIIFDPRLRAKSILHYNPGLRELTPREIDCLKNLRIGTSNKYLSNKLQISIDTVKFHLNNIKLKTGLVSRDELISLSYQLTSHQ